MHAECMCSAWTLQGRRNVVGIGQAKYYRADPQPEARNLLGALLKKVWTSLQGSGAAEEYIMMCALPIFMRAFNKIHTQMKFESAFLTT